MHRETFIHWSTLELVPQWAKLGAVTHATSRLFQTGVSCPFKRWSVPELMTSSLGMYLFNDLGGGGDNKWGSITVWQPIGKILLLPLWRQKACQLRRPMKG